MSRDARINPVAGDVLAIGISQWEVAANSEGEQHVDIGKGVVKIIRMGAYSFLDIGSFRSFFKLASTVRYGDEQ